MPVLLFCIFATKVRDYFTRDDRKERIRELLEAYFMADEYVMKTYFPKICREMIRDFTSPVLLDRFENYDFTDEHRLPAFEWTVQIAMAGRPNTVFYILPILEYSLRLYTVNSDVPVGSFLSFVSDAIYRRSSYDPILRFNAIFTFFLFHLHLI